MADLTKIYSFSCIVSDGRSYLNKVQQHLLDLRIFHRSELPTCPHPPSIAPLLWWKEGGSSSDFYDTVSFPQETTVVFQRTCQTCRFFSLYRWLPKQKTSYRQRLLRWKPEFDGSTNQQKMGYYIAVFECKISTNSTGR